MFLRILQEQKQADEKEEMIARTKKDASLKHSLDIRVQISDKDVLKKQIRQDMLEEGRKVRMN